MAGGASIRPFEHGSPVPQVATLELEASGAGLAEHAAKGASVTWNNPVGTNRPRLEAGLEWTATMKLSELPAGMSDEDRNDAVREKLLQWIYGAVATRFEEFAKIALENVPASERERLVKLRDEIRREMSGRGPVPGQLAF